MTKVKTGKVVIQFGMFAEQAIANASEMKRKEGENDEHFANRVARKAMKDYIMASDY